MMRVGLATALGVLTIGVVLTDERNVVAGCPVSLTPNCAISAGGVTLLDTVML